MSKSQIAVFLPIFFSALVICAVVLCTCMYCRRPSFLGFGGGGGGVGGGGGGAGGSDGSDYTSGSDSSTDVEKGDGRRRVIERATVRPSAERRWQVDDADNANRRESRRIPADTDGVPPAPARTTFVSSMRTSRTRSRSSTSSRRTRNTTTRGGFWGSFRGGGEPSDLGKRRQ